MKVGKMLSALGLALLMSILIAVPVLAVTQIDFPASKKTIAGFFYPNFGGGGLPPGTQGDILVYDSIWEVLPIGETNQVIISQGAGAPPAWTTVFTLSSLSNGKYWASPWNTSNLTVGENVTAGELVFMGGDGALYLTDCNFSTNMTALYLAVETIELGSSGLFIDEGYWRDTGKSETPGEIAYASATPGAITTTIPAVSADLVQEVGTYVTPDILKLGVGIDSTDVVVP